MEWDADAPSVPSSQRHTDALFWLHTVASTNGIVEELESHQKQLSVLQYCGCVAHTRAVPSRPFP